MLKDPRIAFFDANAAKWDELGPPQEVVLKQLDQLLPRLPLGPGQSVLEVGCGTGAYTGWLADKVKPGRVRAIDFSPEMIARARQQNINADFVVADACEADLGTDCYDAVFCLNVFPHFRNPEKALGNLSRALRYGGHLVVLHLMGREALNALHAKIGNAVGNDELKDLRWWEESLAKADLSPKVLEDGKQSFLGIGIRGNQK